MGRQRQGMDRPGVWQGPEGSEEQGKMEKTGCKIICGVPTTLAVKGLMMMIMIDFDCARETFDCYLFILFLLSVSVFAVLSSIFRSLNSPNSTPFSHSVLPISALFVLKPLPKSAETRVS